MLWLPWATHRKEWFKMAVWTATQRGWPSKRPFCDILFHALPRVTKARETRLSWYSRSSWAELLCAWHCVKFPRDLADGGNCRNVNEKSQNRYRQTVAMTRMVLYLLAGTTKSSHKPFKKGMHERPWLWRRFLRVQNSANCNARYSFRYQVVGYTPWSRASKHRKWPWRIS